MKTVAKLCGLATLVVILTFLLPGPAVAQDGKTDLILRLVSNDYYNPVKTGKDNILFLEIQNNGDKSLSNIRMSSNQPKDWTVEFTPSTISALSPGSIQTIDVNIKPVEGASRGEYQVTVIAEANEIRRVQNIWVRVESTSFWLWVGAILGAAVIAAFIIVFMRLGRQQN